MIDYSLPGSDKLRIGVLAGIFNNVSASYKFVFFLSILHILKNGNFNLQPIPLKKIEKEMLKIAWYPHTFYKLNFGFNDQLGIVLDKLSSVSENSGEQTDPRQAISDYLKQNTTTLLNMVPYRLINQFVNKPGYDKNKDLDVIRYASECREEKPLYSFTQKAKSPQNSISLHPQWLSYIKDNYSIIEGFVHWEWLKYMQKRNPNALNIGEKLFSLGKKK